MVNMNWFNIWEIYSGTLDKRVFHLQNEKQLYTTPIAFWHHWSSLTEVDHNLLNFLKKVSVASRRDIKVQDLSTR